MKTFPPVVALVPHRPPMVLLDEVCDWTDATARCRLRLHSSSMFMEEGRVPAVVALEYIAQCVSVHGGYEALCRGEPVRGGYLVGARAMTLEVAHFHPGDELEVTVTREHGNGTLEHYQGEVLRGGLRVAWASISVYHTDPPSRGGEA